ncbi:MAG: ABC transporter ATP-binding protein [Acidimicrobiia bacterium]|nr:ABC transporter ATP-binding protein [Acidimicrobiia bacterium]
MTGGDAALDIRLAALDVRDVALDVRDVDFSYGRVQVLFGVGLTVFRGETVALLGANGAGKSTLLRVVSGLAAPTCGEVVYNGGDVTRLAAEKRIRRGIVQVTGGAATFPPLTVLENLRAGAYIYGRADAARRIDRAFALFPVLDERRKARAADLSGGQQQMLALALGLMHDPEVLVIDELTLGLAPIVVQQMVDVIRGLREQGLTMVIVEHTVDVALEIADRAVFMEKGRIRFAGTSTEFAGRPDLLRVAFLGG